jgi:hypothetical protein
VTTLNQESGIRNHAKIFMILVSCFMFQTSTHAHAADPATWPEVNLRLEAEGINAAQLDWQGINQRCAATHESNSKAYARCQYQSARQEGQFKRDEENCQERAEEVPSPHLQDPVIIIEREPDTQGMTTSERHETLRRYHQRLRYGYSYPQGPKEAYSECMENKGWRDPNQWQSGTR